MKYMEDKFYKKGDILFIRNVRFLDGCIDTSVKGHPFILLDDVYNIGQKVRCLKITSKKHDFQISLPKKIMFKQSFVCINYVYKLEINYYGFPIASLNINQYPILKRLSI